MAAAATNVSHEKGRAMIVVFRKTAKPPRRRAPGLRGHIAAILALVALAIVAAAWFWTARQPPPVEAGFGLPHRVIVVGCGAFVAALIAEIRAMSLADVLEAAWDLLLGLFALIGAILKGIWNAILSLLGWD
jgi:hypothetical protein